FAGVGLATMHNHEQRSRLIIELLAGLLADADASLAAAGAALLGFGQIMDRADTRQFLGQPLPAMTIVLGLGGGGLCKMDGAWGHLGRGGSGLVGIEIGEQPTLASNEALAARTEQTTEQLIQSAL